MKKGAKPVKNNKSKIPEEPEKPPLTWDEQTKEFDLNSISETYQIKFAVLNAESPNSISHIENLQNYLYVNSNLNIKPIIFEEVQYIVKHYPAWNRPYNPPEIEDCFNQACTEAKLYTRKLKPIPLRLMANLIKLRAILLVYEHVYYELNPGENPDLRILSFDNLLSCSSKTEISIEEEDETLTQDHAFIQADTASLNHEIEFDKDTVNMVYNYSSPILQGYVAALQAQWNRIDLIGYEDDFKEDSFRPWVSRHCQYAKDQIPKKTTTQQQKKKSASTVTDSTPKIMYMVLLGFYDVLLVKELHEIGVDFLCLIAFGKENETTMLLPKPDRLGSPSCDSLNDFIDPVYYFSTTSSEHCKKPDHHLECETYGHIKETIILMFWIKMEELCESNSKYYNNIIWFRYATTPRTNEEKVIYSDAYWKAGAKLFRITSQYLHSLVYLKKYHRLYMRSLDVIELGEKPEAIYVNKMFYYNNTLRNVPPDCIKVGHILEGLLDEVCNRVALESTENSEESFSGEYFGEEYFGEQYFCEENFGEESIKVADTPTTKNNKKMETFLLRVLKKFKFSYMPSDPISFFNTHSNLLTLDKNMELKRERFETYDSDKLELETSYYPKIQDSLKLTTIEHLKKSFPALLWKIYDDDDNFQDRSVSSLIFQTWLSFIRLTQRQCNERLSIQFCKSIKCKERSKYYTFCGLHDYFVKPLWISPVYNLHVECSETCKITVNTPQTIRVPSDGNEPEDFHWQEKLTPEVLLQQTSEDFTYYDCFDHFYSPFLDQMIVRFHDPTDDFGSSAYIWEESIRSPIGLYNFFKHIVFEDSKWLRELEDTLTNLDAFPPQPFHDVSQADIVESSQIESNSISQDFKDVPYVLTTIQTFEDIFFQSPFITCNNILTAFNLEDRAGAGGTTTIFHSTEGLKITVDVQRIFGMRNVDLKVQGDRHVFILHANPKYQFLFHFESPNGTRIIFGKPEDKEVKRKGEIIKRKFNKPVSMEKECILKETNYINFKKRSEFGEKRKLKGNSLENLLYNIFSEDSDKSSSSRNSLRDVESCEDIALKSTFSLTTISKRSIQPPIGFEKVFKDLRKAKRNTIPHFKIISTALHKRKYVSVSPCRIILHFSNRSVPIKFIPKVDVSKRIEIAKCTGLDLPFETINIDDYVINDNMMMMEEQTEIMMEETSQSSQATENNDETNAKLNEKSNNNDKSSEKTNDDICNKYDVRITLPSGLQISTFPDPDDPNKCIVVQKYIIKGAMNDSIENEVSRTFTRQGFIRIKYQDGSMKMIGLNGKTISGDIVSIKPEYVKRKPKHYFENLNYHKRVKLHKNIHKKINRFQKRIINKPGLRYLKLTLSKKDKFFKALLNDFKKTPFLLDYAKLTPQQLLTPIIFKIQEDSFQDHYQFNFTTKDSFTSINNDGEQVTSFIDGTIISSWFQISQEMIVIETNDQEEVIEIDDDDYFCNFLVPKVGGWMDVSLCIQFQHRQYATVVYRLDGEEVSIYLPDNIEVKIKSDGNYFLNLSDTMYGQISSDQIKIRSNFCKKCYDCCETNIYVKHLYENNEDIPPYDVLLEAKDNFNKYFKVDYCGICYKNKNYEEGQTSTCQAHRTDTMEKFYSFDRDFSGTAYWTNSMFMDRVLCTHGNYKKENVKYYLDENQSIRAYEIISYFVQHYCDRFLMQYRRPDPPVVLIPKPKPQCFGPVAYIKKRFVEILPDLSAIIPLVNAINEWNVQRPWELRLPTHEMIYGPPPPKIPSTASKESLNIKLSPRFVDMAIEHFENLTSFAKKFRVGTYDSVDSFSKPLDIDQPVCTCATEKLTEVDMDIEKELDTFYEKYPQKSISKQRGKTIWSSTDAVKMPVVPVNSKISNLTNRVRNASSPTLMHGFSNLNYELSSLEFITKTTQKKTKRKQNQYTSLSPIVVTPLQQDVHKKSGVNSGNFDVRFMQPGIYEWRRANLYESSASGCSDIKQEVLEKNINITKKGQYLRDKCTVTAQPFDVLGLDATKKLSGTILVAKSQVKQEVIEKQKNFVTSKQSEKSILKMTSMNKIYKKVSDLKCCPEIEKRSYTESRKPKLIQSEETRSSRIFKELPMILPIKKLNDND